MAVDKLYQIFKEEIMLILVSLFQVVKEEEHF